MDKVFESLERNFCSTNMSENNPFYEHIKKTSDDEGKRYLCWRYGMKRGIMAITLGQLFTIDTQTV